MVRINFYNRTAMREDRSKWIQRRALLAPVIMACFTLLAFATLAKTIQYWPDLNAKLQISNSCKVERHQAEALNCDSLTVAEAPVTLLVARTPLFSALPERSSSLPEDPFVLFIS